MKISIRLLWAFMLGVYISGPSVAQSTTSVSCDQITVGAFPRTAYWEGFTGSFDVRSNGLNFSCRYIFPLQNNLKLVAGFGGMTFVNSFDSRSYAIGANIELQYYFEATKNLGVYAGFDVGIIHGYDGFLDEKFMIGTLIPAGQLKAGVLFDVPDTNLTVFGGLRVIPPVSGLRGTISPTLGMTYHFGPRVTWR